VAAILSDVGDLMVLAVSDEPLAGPYVEGLLVGPVRHRSCPKSKRPFFENQYLTTIIKKIFQEQHHFLDKCWVLASKALNNW
jgi:hypothetical protein